MINVANPLFKLGQVCATPDALALLQKASQTPWEFLARHVQGDWGCMSDDDRQLNDEAVKDGGRILSSYLLRDGQTKIWCLTEAADDDGNRAATRILRPENY